MLVKIKLCVCFKISSNKKIKIKTKKQHIWSTLVNFEITQWIRKIFTKYSRTKYSFWFKITHVKLKSFKIAGFRIVIKLSFMLKKETILWIYYLFWLYKQRIQIRIPPDFITIKCMEFHSEKHIVKDKCAHGLHNTFI